MYNFSTCMAFSSPNLMQSDIMIFNSSIIVDVGNLILMDTTVGIAYLLWRPLAKGTTVQYILSA